MKKYEAIFILDDQKVDDGGKALAKDAEALLVELGGTIDSERSDSMGQRQLAHNIGRRSTGIYWSIVVELPEEQVAVFKDRYRRNESVLRLEIFIFDRPDKISLKDEPEEEDET